MHCLILRGVTCREVLLDTDNYEKRTVIINERQDGSVSLRGKDNQWCCFDKGGENSTRYLIHNIVIIKGEILAQYQITNLSSLESKLSHGPGVYAAG